MKNLFLFLVGLSINPLAQAGESLTCQTRVLACGKGEVKIGITADNQFYLSNGDVRCWLPNYEFSGSVEPLPERSHMHNLQFGLIAQRNDLGEVLPVPEKIGVFEIDNDRTLVKLILNTKYFITAGGVYHLSCQNED